MLHAFAHICLYPPSYAPVLTWRPQVLNIDFDSWDARGGPSAREVCTAWFRGLTAGQVNILMGCKQWTGRFAQWLCLAGLFCCHRPVHALTARSPPPPPHHTHSLHTAAACPKVLERFRHEVEFQRRLSFHPHVVRFIGACCEIPEVRALVGHLMGGEAAWVAAVLLLPGHPRMKSVL